MFICFCIFFGVGMRFIIMFNYFGLIVSWENVMKFFDRRKVKKGEEILK